MGSRSLSASAWSEWTMATLLNDIAYWKFWRKQAQRRFESGSWWLNLIMSYNNRRRPTPGGICSLSYPEETP